MNQQKTVGFFLKRVDCNDGVASHCETLIRGLIANNWRVVMITGPISYDSTSIGRFETLKHLVEDWIIFDQIHPLLPNLSYLFKIQEIIKRYEISLLHAHGYSMLLFCRILCLFNHLNCVATYHPSIHGDDSKALKAVVLNPKLRQYKFYLTAFSPKTFIACSSDTVSFLNESLGFPKSKISKILLGIDTKYFRPPTPEERQKARERFGLQQNDTACMLVGRLNWNKGHDILIEAARQARTELPHTNLKCLFAGSGAQENQIKEYALVSEADKHCFVFLGYTDDLREVYWAADIFVLPSRSEGFALVVAEAMCCGVVPVRTPGGGAKDQIEDGINGFVVPFDDSETLARRLKLLSSDVEFREQLSLEAQKTARQKFTADQMVESTIAVYEEILNPAKSSLMQ